MRSSDFRECLKVFEINMGSEDIIKDFINSLSPDELKYAISCINNREDEIHRSIVTHNNAQRGKE